MLDGESAILPPVGDSGFPYRAVDCVNLIQWEVELRRAQASIQPRGEVFRLSSQPSVAAGRQGGTSVLVLDLVCDPEIQRHTARTKVHTPPQELLERFEHFHILVPVRWKQNRPDRQALDICLFVFTQRPQGVTLRTVRWFNLEPLNAGPNGLRRDVVEALDRARGRYEDVIKELICRSDDRARSAPRIWSLQWRIICEDCLCHMATLIVRDSAQKYYDKHVGPASRSEKEYRIGKFLFASLDAEQHINLMTDAPQEIFL